MAIWFSASVAVPNWVSSGRLDVGAAAALTAAVQLGFVAGTLLSALMGLADRFDPRKLFAAAAFLGAVANGLLLLTGFEGWAALTLRFIAGMCMAGVYPVGMKLAAGWAAGDMGLLVGALVGALTLGSAMPHLFNAFADLDWRVPIAFASLSALTSVIAIRWVRLGPGHRKSQAFRWTELASLLRRSKPILLAQGGYLGHMWELYAMWAWLGSFLVWALPASGLQVELSFSDISLITFLVMAIGALGCLTAGMLADRIGRTATTIIALAVSGTCAAVIGFSVYLGPIALLVVAAIWGLTVVADSAQFSAAVAELAEPEHVGSILTLQTCIGFLLTAGVIWWIPQVAEQVGWQYAFCVLAIGPALGIWSMLTLRRHPEAVRMASGRR